MNVSRSDYMQRIMPFMNKPLIKVISGMRRVGKSTIVRMLIDELLESGVPEKNILYINKESLQWDSITDYKELHTQVQSYFLHSTSGPRYLFIDEVQEIREWERAVNSLLSEHLADITITGSNAHLLASDLATLLSGRYIEFPVFPLTFKEFLLFRMGKETDIQENLRCSYAMEAYPVSTA
jgi:uncharacterized protein